MPTTRCDCCQDSHRGGRHGYSISGIGAERPASPTLLRVHRADGRGLASDRPRMGPASRAGHCHRHLPHPGPSGRPALDGLREVLLPRGLGVGRPEPGAGGPRRRADDPGVGRDQPREREARRRSGHRRYHGGTLRQARRPRRLVQGRLGRRTGHQGHGHSLGAQLDRRSRHAPAAALAADALGPAGGLLPVSQARRLRPVPSLCHPPGLGGPDGLPGGRGPAGRRNPRRRRRPVRRAEHGERLACRRESREPPSLRRGAVCPASGPPPFGQTWKKPQAGPSPAHAPPDGRAPQEGVGTHQDPEAGPHGRAPGAGHHVPVVSCVQGGPDPSGDRPRSGRPREGRLLLLYRRDRARRPDRPTGRRPLGRGRGDPGGQAATGLRGHPRLVLEDGESSRPRWRWSW
jgi:hypothetical protein